MRKILYGILLFSVISCGSVRNYAENDINQEFFKGKTLVFKLNPASVENFNMQGMYGGSFAQPNVKEVFSQAVAEMATETKLDLKATRNSEEANVDAKIQDITWNFKFSNAELTTKIDFKANWQNYATVGSFKRGYGSESNNLRMSLKNAIYKFLLEYQKDEIKTPSLE